jgi:hypothetical protein
MGYWTYQMIEREQIDTVRSLCCLGFSLLLAEIYTGRWYEKYVKNYNIKNKDLCSKN